MPTYNLKIHGRNPGDLITCSIERPGIIEDAIQHLTKTKYQSFITGSKAVIVNMDNVIRVELEQIDV